MTSTQERPRLRTEVDGDVWRITLDRPEAGNALDPALAEQLAQALRARPRETRTVLLLAAGPRFSVGGDISYFAAAEDHGAAVGQLAHDWHEVIRLLINCPVPVVAGAQGAVAGAAVGLIGACDIVVCARSTTDGWSASVSYGHTSQKSSASAKAKFSSSSWRWHSTSSAP